MEYTRLSNLYARLEGTPKRLEKTLILSQFLMNVPIDELEQVMLLIQGIVYPIWDERKLGFSSSYIIKALATASGTTPEKIKDLWRETGDLGECACKLMGKRKQSTLFSKKLTIKKVFDNLRSLAGIEGLGSVDVKVQLVAELLTSAEALEAKFITRTVLDELRIGLGEGTLRDAVVWSFLPKVKGISTQENSKNALKIESIEDLKGKKIDDYETIESEDESVAREAYNFLVGKVQHALDVCNDFGIVAATLKKQGLVGLKKIPLIPGTPIKVMLAIKENTVAAAFERVGAPAACEYKLDGFRMQIHASDNELKMYTRRLENITAQFPDVAKLIRKQVNAKSFILDSEAIGIDKTTGKYLPFQNISQRIRRKYDIEQMAHDFPVEVHVFDILYYDGKSMLSTPFEERRRILEKILSPNKLVKLITQIVTDKEEDGQKFYEQSLKAGNEGMMVKSMNAVYRPGSRVGTMVKLKSTMETLDVVIVGAEWGEGKRSSWLSSFIIAIRDDNEELRIVGRVATGLKEKKEEGLSFEDITNELRPLITSQKGKEVAVTPKIVIEVSYEEIQKSPSYSSGFALRFPRVTRRREDRDAKTCSTISDVKRLYDSQRP